ncbi:BZ3501_MvSof-1269-A2-R1_Chr5-2g07520 [Microbotryum saponariae]|nr:BZ3501_MvSof-1269-A2-R1_Chr5-2g07520 [Microbotryum saponariae]
MALSVFFAESMLPPSYLQFAAAALMIHWPSRASPMHDNRSLGCAAAASPGRVFTASRLLDRGALCYVVLPRNLPKRSGPCRLTILQRPPRSQLNRL